MLYDKAIHAARLPFKHGVLDPAQADHHTFGVLS